MTAAGFGPHATAEEVTAGLDLTGRTALVTGATAGIGFETMRVLALRGARVLAVGRTREKAAAAAARLGDGLAGAVTPLGCDQERLADVAACADAVRGLGAPLDIVIANAGVVGRWRRETIGGLEKTFVVNHLAPFVLINRLLDRITATPDSRIVVVGSNAYKRAPAAGIEFDNLSAARGYFFMKQYGQTKLANYLFTRSLARRLAGASTTANVIHPGRVRTNIFHNLPLPLRLVVGAAARYVMKDVPAGASTMCYAATHPSLKGVTGRYFADNRECPVGGHMADDAMAERLWAVSEDLTRPYLPQPPSAL